MMSREIEDIRRDFESREIMAENLADAVATRLREGIKARGQVYLSVGGGRFPKPFFQRLSLRAIEWSKVVVVLGDERWVTPDDAASNEKLVRDNLLCAGASVAGFIGLKTSHDDPEKGLPEIEKRLAVLPDLLDVTILGMGEDGHTASLFPSAFPHELSQALSPVGGEQAALMNPSVSDVPRISLTLPRIKASRWIVVAAPGEAKLHTFEQAMRGNDIQAMPVRAILKDENVPVEFWWAP
ncbi:MAG: 6-phosphogluconolactonase [Deltaproteobacteria bacterium]|nr:6-phosphogluconolactonase [Deltaproteobacteria bacterium]